ncbi:hypothetical protein GQ600_3437 [Phytophthora cactorum]|nr:hypothetical protein GQ600_3437 [Phytophthora cactorum]
MLTKEYQYYDGIDAEKSFLFGPEDDDDGFPRIRKGSDAGAFVLGETTRGLLSKINQLRGEEHFCRTDAAFKVSDLGYAF